MFGNHAARSACHTLHFHRAHFASIAKHSFHVHSLIPPESNHRLIFQEPDVPNLITPYLPGNPFYTGQLMVQPFGGASFPARKLRQYDDNMDAGAPLGSRRNNEEHCVLERTRRAQLKNDFDRLKLVLPNICGAANPSRSRVLTEATNEIHRLQKQDADLMAAIRILRGAIPSEMSARGTGSPPHALESNPPTYQYY
jgi:hypothetical protein